MAKCLILFLLCLTLFLPAKPAAAANWFAKFGESVITHGDSSWESQKMGHYAAGGLSIRVPNDSSPLFNITPPRIMAGCGGIDAFWGGFSFLNPEFLIQKLKSILQAAPSYAFDLALTHLCQTCSNILKSLEAIANELNSLAVDDCKASQALVNAGANFLVNTLGVSSQTGDTSGGGADFLSDVSKSLSSFMQTTANNLSDFRNSLNKMLSYKYCEGSTSHTDRDKCLKAFSVSGSMWDRAQVLSVERGDMYAIDEGMLKVLKSVYGDVIFKAPDEVETKGSDKSARLGLIQKKLPCEFAIHDMLTAMTSVSDDADKLPIRIVPSGKKQECEAEEAGTVFGSQYYLFGKQAKAAIEDIKKSMRTGSALQANTLKLINQSAIPVYTALNIMNLRRGMNPTGSMNSDDEILASMLAAGNAFFILEGMHSRAQDVLGEVKVFHAQITPEGPYNLNQANEAVASMTETMERVRFWLTDQIMADQRKYLEHIDGIVKYMSMRTVFKTMLANSLL